MREVEQIERERLAEIERALMTFRLDADAPGIADALPAITELTGLENIGLYSLRKGGVGVEFERFDTHRIPVALMERARSHFTTTPERLFYDYQRPDPAQRDRVLEVRAYVDRTEPGTWEASPICREVFAPMGMARHNQLRVLITEHDVMLGWFGGFQLDAIRVTQHRALGALVPALRRRLSVERRLASSVQHDRLLHALVEQLGAPAFVTTATGNLVLANHAGRAMLDGASTDVQVALRDAIARRPTTIAFELVEIRERGLPCHVLAVARPDPATRLKARVSAAVSRYHLTPRQAEVLGLLVRGLANATIAGLLRISERAVELHVTALFDRVGADSRAMLLAHVLAP